MKANIKNSEALSQAAWEGAARRVVRVAGAIADSLMRANRDGKGKEDKEALMADIQLAATAMYYVARFARDKCRIITVTDEEAIM